MKSNRLGYQGEEIAAKYLEQKGYKILKKRFRGGGGEVDIIAREGEVFVFIEVKTRRFLDMEDMERSLNSQKRSRIEQASLDFLLDHHLDPELTKIRFDCIFQDGQRLVHLPGAWEKDG